MATMPKLTPSQLLEIESSLVPFDAIDQKVSPPQYPVYSRALETNAPSFYVIIPTQPVNSCMERIVTTSCSLTFTDTYIPPEAPPSILPRSIAELNLDLNPRKPAPEWVKERIRESLEQLASIPPKSPALDP